MTEYKEEIESQLLIDTAHKPEPAPVVAAVPDRIGAWMVLLFFGCGAAVVLFAKRTTRFYFAD